MVETEPIVRKIAHGEILTPEQLLEYPFFKGISEKLLQKNLGAVVRRTFKKGEIICREGEEGSTAFYILKGTVDIFITTAVSHVQTQPEAKTGWFRKMKSLLVGPPAATGKTQQRQRYIPIDASVDLSVANPVAQLEEGDLFGEMTCLSFYPRSATVRAAEDCVVLEMLRNILQLLQKNKEFKVRVEDAYRKRTLDRHLRSVEIFGELSSDFLEFLKARVELVDFAPGEIICKQDEDADAFYLIRLGNVKVSQRYPGGEMVLTYLSRGQYFGEIGLLGHSKRTATCSALDKVEAVKIRKEDFDAMVRQFPAIGTQLQKVADQRLETNRQQSKQLETVFLNDFLGQSLMDANNLLLIDLEKCTRCDDCVRACAASHDGITRLIRDGVRYDKYLVATSCRQCLDPLCMVGCPVGAIHRQPSREIVIEDWCIGCGLCAKQCPYENINLHEFVVKQMDPETGQQKEVVTRKATVCDLCGQHTEPSCVYACPHDAAHRVDPKEFFPLQSIDFIFPKPK